MINTRKKSIGGLLMKKGLKIMLSIVFVLVLLGNVAFASTEITAYLADFKLFLNGNRIDKEIIEVDGSSYLPVRAISEALGLDVKWDGKKQSIFLTSNSNSSGKSDEHLLDVNYNPVINPSNFVNGITNEYFPLTPGKVYTYKSQTEDEIETIVVTVLPETKTVAGVTCTVVRDTVTVEGELIEDTYDWYAQDIDGNVWYMGEYVSNYDDGLLEDHDGSFEAGVDGAKPGIVMFANPVLEMPYRQEYCLNVAEDWGKVIAKGVTVITPYGTFNNCIKTQDWNPLEPDAAMEYKYYAPGVGLVKEEVEKSPEVAELIKVE